MTSSTRFYNIVLLCINIVVINLSSQKTNESYALFTTTLTTNTNNYHYRNHRLSSSLLSRFSVIDNINTMDQNSRMMIRRQQETRMISSGRGQRRRRGRGGGGRRTQQGSDVIKMSPSSSNVEDESINNNDDQDDDLSKCRSARQSSSSSMYFNWWRKDPRNRSVFGVLTGMFHFVLIYISFRCLRSKNRRQYYGNFRNSTSMYS